MKNIEIQESVLIRSTPEQVYLALTTPASLRLWYGSVSQLALRAGACFTHADPSGDVYESGEFLEVKKNELLRFRMEHHGFCRGSEVTVRLVAKGDATQVSLVHAGLGEADAAHMRAQWDWAFTNLQSFVEEGRVQSFQGWYAIPANQEKHPL